MAEKQEMDHRFAYSRDAVDSKGRRNLRYMLKNRYDWITRFITPDQRGLELGSGAGHIRVFIPGYNYITTDICDLPWLDRRCIDAQRTPFENESFDYIIAKNVVHHLDKPLLFFNEAERLLKKGGRLIILEPYSSVILRLLIKLSGHEHCRKHVNVLSPDYSLNSYARNQWDGNNCAGRLLFDRPGNFQAQFNQFELIHKSFSEFMIFINSGGVYLKTFYIPLNKFLLKAYDKGDQFLVRVFPRFFALAIRVVFEKK